MTRSFSTARHADAVANAVVHAYPDRPGGNVRVHASQEPPALLIIVSDDGQGVAPGATAADSV